MWEEGKGKVGKDLGKEWEGKMEGRGATKSQVGSWLAGWGGCGAWTTGKARKGNWRAGNIEREQDGGKYGQPLQVLRAGFGLGQVPEVPTYQGRT